LTLETATFFCCVEADFRAAGFGVAFLLFGTGFRDAAAFFAALILAGLRAEAFVTLARLALGRADFVLTTRFAALAEARLPDGRDVDRRKPFVRLLLMLILKRAAQLNEQPQVRAELNIALLLNQRAQVFAGVNNYLNTGKCLSRANKEKHLKVTVGYARVLYRCWRLRSLRHKAPG